MNEFVEIKDNVSHNQKEKGGEKFVLARSCSNELLNPFAFPTSFNDILQESSRKKRSNTIDQSSTSDIA